MKDEEIVKTVVKVGILTILGIIGLICFFGSWFVVNAGERGILIIMGNPKDVAYTEGFHWKAPIFQDVVKIDIKTQKYESKASAASKDLQIVSTDIAVNYHLESNSVVRLYKELGIDYENRVIQPAVQEVVNSFLALMIIIIIPIIIIIIYIIFKNEMM